MVTKILTVLIAITIPANVYAFHFDLWDSGISLNKAKTIANSHNINLTKLRKSLDLKNNVERISYQYIDHLFGEYSQVTLTFTHSSNILYETKISWENLTNTKANKIYNEISSILTNKYGLFEKFAGKTYIVKNGNECKGISESISRDSQDDIILLSRHNCFNSLILYYRNETLKNVNQEEASDEQKINFSDAEKL